MFGLYVLVWDGFGSALGDVVPNGICFSADVLTLCFCLVGKLLMTQITQLALWIYMLLIKKSALANPTAITNFEYMFVFAWYPGTPHRK